jgi:UDP-N-acetylglucosamine:LPS N-acetylglucosamine transferase
MREMQKKVISEMIMQGGRLMRESSSASTIKSGKGVIFHVRKYMKDMVELMASSSLIITKTGSCTVNEGIHLGVKLLLDNTENSSARYLQWKTSTSPS